MKKQNRIVGADPNGQTKEWVPITLQIDGSIPWLIRLAE
jgi:hypothetical protein